MGVDMKSFCIYHNPPSLYLIFDDQPYDFYNDNQWNIINAIHNVSIDRNDDNNVRPSAMKKKNNERRRLIEKSGIHALKGFVKGMEKGIDKSSSGDRKRRRKKR